MRSLRLRRWAATSHALRLVTCTCTCVLQLACSAPAEPPRASAPTTRIAGSAPIRWRLAHHETFDAPFPDPPWVEDHHGPDSPYHVDRYDDDGEFFHERGGETFARGLAAFRSFRKSFTYGDQGWLTAELYGRDSDRDGVPDSGGRFEGRAGRAHLVSTRHHDGAILRSTRPLPPRYRIEVTVSVIRFGGDGSNGSWFESGRFNGYDGDERADPWSFRDDDPTPRKAVTQNGVYFLCITDYPRPAPHNNVFIHHHRKVVMDTDNNESPDAVMRGRSDAWSSIWNPGAGRPEVDGARYVSMIWLDGEHPRDPWTGNRFISWAGERWFSEPVFVDKYYPAGSYRFAIERDERGYAMSVTGHFQHGGQRTYRARRDFAETPATWHYNQTPAERVAGPALPAIDGWPAEVGYPDHFFFGDPHINFYEGSADFDDVSLYLPDDDGDDTNAVRTVR